MKKIFALLIMGLFSVFLLISCTETTKSKQVVRIGFPGTSSVLSGAPGIAQIKGYFEEELKSLGYEIEYKAFAAAGPAVNEALASGEVDIVLYADFPGIISKANGIDTELIGIYDNFINAAIVVSPDSNISSIEELKGKKIGFIKGTYLQRYLFEALKDNNIDLNEVELINTQDVDSVLQSGSVDAVVVTDGSEALAVTTKKVAKTLESTRNNPKLSSQGIVIGRKDYLDENKEAAVGILKAIERGKKYFIENPEESYEMLTNTGQSLEASKALYKKDNEKFDYITINIDSDSKNRLEETKKFLIDNNLIKSDFSINDWINKDIYEESIK